MKNSNRYNAFAQMKKDITKNIKDKAKRDKAVKWLVSQVDEEITVTYATGTSFKRKKSVQAIKKELNEKFFSDNNIKKMLCQDESKAIKEMLTA